MTSRDEAEKVIIEAENFRAQIQPPKGNLDLVDNDIMKLFSNHVDDDDSFST